MEHDSPCNRRARRLNCKISRLKIVRYDDGDHSSATEQPAEIARRKSTLQRVLTVEEILNRHAATCCSFSLILSLSFSLPLLSLSLFLCRRMPNDRFENFGFRVREKAPPHCTAAPLLLLLRHSWSPTKMPRIGAWKSNASCTPAACVSSDDVLRFSFFAHA